MYIVGKELFYLIYKSTNSYNIPIDQIEKLSELAAKSNAKQNITGLLIREKSGFIQYLEGNKTKVVMLYEKLLRDKRHHSLEVLDSGTTNTRRFRRWSLMLKHISASEIKAIETIRNPKSRIINGTLDEINKELALLIFKKFQQIA